MVKIIYLWSKLIGSSLQGFSGINVVEGLSHVSRSESEGERGGYGDGAGDGRAGWLTGRERL